MTQLPRRVAGLAVAVLVALGGWLAAATPAAAHNVLRSTTPGDRSVVDRVPGQVVLAFDEPALALGTELVVTGPDGPVQEGSARLVDTTVQQALRPGSPSGTYTVQWRVTSADGHPISGSFTFIARAAGAASATSASPATPAPIPSPAADRASGYGVPPWLWVVVVLLLSFAGLTSIVLLRRRQGPPG
jgi:copper resistance protein C